MKRRADSQMTRESTEFPTLSDDARMITSSTRLRPSGANISASSLIPSMAPKAGMPVFGTKSRMATTSGKAPMFGMKSGVAATTTTTGTKTATRSEAFTSLNAAFVKWITEQVKVSASCNLTPCLTDYLTHCEGILKSGADVSTTGASTNGAPKGRKSDAPLFAIKPGSSEVGKVEEKTKAPLFGNAKSTAPMFGGKTNANESGSAEKTKAPLFGNAKSTAPLFGGKTNANESESAEKTKAPLFGNAKSTAPLFGGKTNESGSAEKTKAPLFGNAKSTAPFFGSSSGSCGSKPLFGSSSGQKPLFGSGGGTADASNLFGKTSMPAASSSLFGVPSEPWSPAIAAKEAAEAKANAEPEETKEDQDTTEDGQSIKLTEGEEVLIDEKVKFKFIGKKVDGEGVELDQKEWKNAGLQRLMVTEVNTKVRFLIVETGGLSKIFVNAFKSSIMDIKLVPNKQKELLVVAINCVVESELKQYRLLCDSTDAASNIHKALSSE